MHYKRTNMAGEVDNSLISKEVVLMGWVSNVRNLGSLVFIDLRDTTGICQVVVRQEDHEIYKEATKIAKEYVIEVKGKIRERESKNPNLKNGDIELLATGLYILDSAKTPPIYIKDNDNASEQTRLKYRYLDLRKFENQKRLKMRAEIFKQIRDYMYENRFVEVETPFLTKTTPEGARDYLVPSRVNPKKFYALPQSPQLMKQLLMISGMDRYYQIVKCFRDEDLRANRQPEFTQLDMELSFADLDDVINVNEGLLKKLFDKFTDYNLKLPIRRIDYSEAMTKYGSDKPDLRYDLFINDITELASEIDFPLFKENCDNQRSIRAINFKNLEAKYSRKQIDKLKDFTKDFGLEVFVYLKKSQDKINSSINKFLTDKFVSDLSEKLNLENGDLVIIAAGKDKNVLESLGELRRKIAKDNNLYERDYALCWVVNFPMFEFSEEENRYVSQHHPFTKPNDEDIQYLKTKPQEVRTQAYDIVVNGEELGGGSVRINNSDLQKEVFEALQLTDEEIQNKFGFFIEALKYGTPPHAGIAYGLDRMTMLFTDTDNIRNVIAFPKTQSATCLLTEAPSYVDEESLKELSIGTIE